MSLGIRTRRISKHSSPIHPGTGSNQDPHGSWADGLGGDRDAGVKSKPESQIPGQTSLDLERPQGLGLHGPHMRGPLGSAPTRTSIPTPEGMPEPPAVMFNPAGKWTDETFSWMLSVHKLTDEMEAAGLPTDHIKAWRDELWAERTKIADQMELKINQALTMGEITFEEAEKAGARRPSWAPSEGDPWIDLPETTFHATTALSVVQAEGLKSRVELNMGEGGVGLGGGASDTISLTTDRMIAENIDFHIKERWRVLNNPDLMVDMANDAFHAGWYMDAVKGGLADVTDPEIRRDLFEGYTKTYISPSQYGDYLPEGMTVSQAIKDPETMASMVSQYITDSQSDRFDASYTPEHVEGPYWRVKRTEAGRMEVLGDWMDSYVAHRSWNGGPDNPLFFSTDDYAFSQLDGNDFGVVELRAKPGTKGVRLSSLGEIRIFTGEAVEVIG